MSSLSAAIRTAQSESRRRQEFFLLQKVRPGSWAHPASFSMDTGVKHSGREVYHSSPPSVEVMNEWSCISTSPRMPSWRGQGLFSHRSHARYMPRPSRRNEVAMQCEAPVIQISACCYLPAGSTHSAATPLCSPAPLLLLAQPTMLHVFIVITLE